MKIRDKIQFDVVSTQFAIHYMFESEKTLRGYLANVAKRLVDGGTFVGTTIDADRLVHKVREAGGENNLTIGNEYFSIVFGQDTFRRSNGPFGLKYYFYLEDAIGKRLASGAPLYVDEYLVPFDTLVAVAKEYGLELVKKVNFHEYFDQEVHGAAREADRDARHVPYQQHLFDRMVKQRLGDLPQDAVEKQWEVVGLYCVFIFKKVGESSDQTGAAAQDSTSHRGRERVNSRDHRDNRDDRDRRDHRDNRDRDHRDNRDRSDHRDHRDRDRDYRDRRDYREGGRGRGRGGSSHPRRQRPNFGNNRPFRPVIDSKNWD